jgi:hypothetical protein
MNVYTFDVKMKFEIYAETLEEAKDLLLEIKVPDEYVIDTFEVLGEPSVVPESA